jgi:hypothetical protein
MKFLSDILAKAGLTVDGVVTLNNTATGQTPDANDNSTKLATTAWVRTFVQPYSLPIASASILGGIKVGTGLSIDSGTGILSVTGASASSLKSTQTFVVTEGQTVFTVTNGYSPGLIDIFLNGVYLSPNQSTATNGSTFTLNEAPAAGDIIDVIVVSPVYQGTSTTTDQLPEGVVNLYYTNTRARAAISLTTTGVSGAATYNSSTGVFNIPNYQGLVPSGGIAGDILAKVDGTNYNVAWIPNYTSQVQHYVKLGATMTAGTAVYVSGSTGGSGTNMIVSKASNASEATSSKTLGLLKTGGITNDEVFVVTEGLLAGLDTSTANAGDPVWLGVNGALIFGLLNKPTAPAHLVFIGVVTRVQQNNGEIFVKVQNGFELDELHDLSVKNASDGDMIKYVASTGLWTKIAASTTNIVEGTNLYYTQGRFDTAFAAKSTTNLAEGTNLYYTDARVGTYLTNNSYATQTYVNTAVSNLVDAAPGTLDTLNELAAALGDDPNFATTVATSIGTKQAQLNGTGFVKVSGTTVSYDNSTYYLASNPNGYITGISFANVSAKPTTIAGYGITDSLVYTTSTYSNPSWITTLAWSKITGAPAFITGYTETDTLATVTARGSSTTAGITVNGRVTAAGGGTYAVTGSSTQRYIIQALNTSNSVNTSYGWWWFHNSNGDMGFHADAVGDILTLTRGGGATINGNTILTAANYSSYALPLSGGTLTGPIILNDSSYFRGSSTYGFRFNNNVDSLNNMTLSNGNGDLFVRGQVYVGGNGSTTGTQVIYNTGTWGINITGNASTASIASIATDLNAADSTQINFNNVTNTDYSTMTFMSRAWSAVQGANGLAYNFTTHNNNGGGGYGAFQIYYGESGYVYAPTSFRAPIFYDSQDTGYYVDPNSFSRLSTMQIDRIGVGQSVDNSYRIITSGDIYLNANGNGWAEGVWKQRRTGGTYYDVIDAGNIGSQSVNYASSSGNSDTVDGYHATNAASGLARYESNGYLYIPNWLNVNNGGIFSSTNNAHIRPNTGSYGAWEMIGSRNGWSGIWFNDSSDYLMANSNEVGHYQHSVGWKFRWYQGTMYVSRGTNGGGTEYTVVDTGNISSYTSGNTNSISAAVGGSYTWTAANYFRSNLGGYCGSLSNPPLQAYSDSNNSAFMSFHKGGHYAVNFGLDADNVLRIGGWSASANRWELDMSGNNSIPGYIRANGGFGTNGAGSGGNTTSGRVYGPAGGAYSFSGGGITGAIKIRLPFRNNDLMWSMKVRIYNYSTNETSEYLLGNYAYSQGGWNSSASFIGGSSAVPRTVRFGNEGGYDCVWIGETSTSWSYPVISIMDFAGGYSNGGVNNYLGNWDITITQSIGTVGTTITPAIRFSDVTTASITATSINAPSGYVSNGNPWGTSNSAFFPNGITTAGGTNWIYGNTYVGNAPSNGDGHNFSTSGVGESTREYNIGKNSGNNWGLGVYYGNDYNGYGRIRFYQGGSNHSTIHSFCANWQSGSLAGHSTGALNIEGQTGVTFGAWNNIDAYIARSGSAWFRYDVTAYSDSRVKTNVKVVDNAIEKIQAIRGVTFNRTDKTDTDKRYAGVIAQEVLPILPEVVTQDTEGMYSVSYGNMAALFIEAIKEQQVQIESQKTEIEELKDLVKQLINR